MHVIVKRKIKKNMAWENLEIEPIMKGAYNVLEIQCVPQKSR